MTTITIKNGLKKNEYTYNTMQAIEDMFTEMGMVLLQPIKNKEILTRTKQHFEKNQHRDFDSYNNI